MKRTILAASLAASRAAALATLPVLLGVSVVQAQPASAGSAAGASQLPDSGPAVVGGTGETLGPNSKNQAIGPIPGMREEELSERPPDATITTPDVRPVTGNPAPKR